MEFSLHYVWIQATRLALPSKDARISCPIPEEFMNNVQKTKERFPNASVNLWVDIYGFGNHADPLMQGLQTAINSPSIRIRSLEDVAEYTDRLFHEAHTNFEDEASPIWKQLDLARLYVLKKCLIEEPNEAHIYCDLDVVLEARALKILEEHGVVISKKDYLVENQMIGFKSTQVSFLLDNLIPETIRAIDLGMNGWDGCVQAFKQGDDIYDAPGLSMPVQKIPNAKAIKDSCQLRR